MLKGSNYFSKLDFFLQIENTVTWTWLEIFEGPALLNTPSGNLRKHLYIY